jgi:DNA-binding MarR family transcriptional regulator
METANVARTVNLIGALALGLSDQIVEASERAVDAGAGAPAAIVLIGTTAGMTIDDLRHGLKLTHSAAVRAVMRLVEAGLVVKEPGKDARSVSLRLTPKGHAKMKRILEVRRSTIGKLLHGVDDATLLSLERILDAILHRLPSTRSEAESICRLCDEKACPPAACPVFVEPATS